MKDSNTTSKIKTITRLLTYCLVLFVCNPIASAETDKTWTASRQLADAILQSKTILYAQEVAFTEPMLTDLYTTLGVERLKVLNFSRFEFLANLPSSNRRTLRPSPRYGTVITGVVNNFDLHITDHIPQTESGENEILSNPIFYRNRAKWLLILDKLAPDVQIDANKLADKSIHFRSEQINGIAESRGAFQIVDQRSIKSDSVLTTAEYEELRAIHLTLKTNGFVTDPQIAALKSDFAKELAKKLNAAVKK